MVVLLLAAGSLAFVLTRDSDPTPVERELERLSSTDGLYTGPQIRAQAGFSLSQTASARAALAVLASGAPVAAPDREVAARLQPDPQEGVIEEALARAVLADPVGEDDDAAPTLADVRRLAGTIPPRTTTGERVERYADLAELARRAGGDLAGLGAAVAAKARTAVRRSRADDDPAVQLARVRVLQALGARPDAAVRAVADGRGLRRPADPPERVQHAAARLVATAFADPQRDRSALEQELVRAAEAARVPDAVWLAVRTLREEGADPEDLADLAPALREELGRSGAVRERAVFPMIPKAVWLVARLRQELGVDALPEDRVVRLSQVLASPEVRGRNDPEAYGLLLAAGKLAGLSYEGPGVRPVQPPPGDVRQGVDALVWNQRARLARDLGLQTTPPRVRPWALSDDVELGALGALLQGARRTGVRVAVPPAFQRRFVATAGRQRYRGTRWALYAAGGLAAAGADAEADRLLARTVDVGCRDYAHLVAERDGTCDLESTLLLLELEDELPAAGKLAAEVRAG